MPRSRLNTYLRTHRLKAALTQAELGELIGVSEDAIGGYEREERAVSVQLLIASEIIFGVSTAELFPVLYETVEDELATNALRFYQRFANREDPASRKKRALVSGIPSRLREATEP